MANTNEVYAGTDYGLDPYHGKIISQDYDETGPALVADIGASTDPRTANQVKAVSDKLSTGVKAVEVELVSPEVAESIPRQHMKEINRLRKLVGAELTMHGPVVEPTGVTRQGWDESQRVQAERQMWSAVERGQELNPKGNVNITFHTSNGLPSPETRVINEQTGEEELKEVWLVDEATGNFRNIVPEISRLEAEEGRKIDIDEAIRMSVRNQEKEQWFNRLQNVNFHANQGADLVHSGIAVKTKEGIMAGENLKKLYGKYVRGKAAAELAKLNPQDRAAIEQKMQHITRGDIYLRDAYSQFQNLFNLAFKSAEKKGDEETLSKLKKFRTELRPKISAIEDPTRVDELGDALIKGVTMLRSIGAPKPHTLLKDFAVDKGSETFSNLALKAYNKFGKNAPVLSIENPPAGMGLTRADDIKDLIVTTRRKFVEKMVESGKLSEDEATKQAEKLIGATWDLGHSNMLRKYGYGETALIEEAKKIAPFTKKIHLSDNFGFEHTEIPVGMGTTPYKKQIEALSKFNNRLKKIIEVSGPHWYQHFQKTPLPEVLSALGSPIYTMKMSPTWGEHKGRGLTGEYFAGYGMNPQLHHAMYGAGFSTLPVSLGGQVEGKSRFSGAPIE